ncbi:peptidoglycan-binding domain-containing protein [Leptolyngbya sp. Heron Island J]|uniref:peptidoglycan-binding domain-containing protein n=1 Tax=Leptolyngbya sp. Heron Island J TaxID=1385935 RepID=UPI001378BC6D|nr:peptidoglycan-binding protein [Leptolyngbya sp. Heron Island J]
MMTLRQQNMGILGFLHTTNQTARLSVKLFMGAWLLSCVPVMAAPTLSSSLAASPMLLAQSRITSLREGDQGPAVTELQRRLSRNGLFPTVVNGIYGPATTQAVRQFQRIRRLDVTGIADQDTLDLLGVNLDLIPVGLSHPDHGFISSDSITPNSSREDIRTLQRVLRMFGFNITADGVYGSQTRQAVRTYERTAGLPVDGIADRTTLINMGFNAGGNNVGGSAPTGSSRSPQGRYVAAIITAPSELSKVQQDFPNATVERNNLGEYISIGRFIDPDDADDWADFASDLGYEARVLRD